MHDINLESLMDADPSPELSVYLATSSDPDTLRYDEAMQAPDREGFCEAMGKEIDSLDDWMSSLAESDDNTTHGDMIYGLRFASQQNLKCSHRNRTKTRY
jgi:hypothetical protein